MTFLPTLTNQRGFLLTTTLIVMGLLGFFLGAYLAILPTEINLVTRATARAQALYLAEAGLDAANDVLSQQWEAYQDPLLFPMREQLAVSLEGREVLVGEFEVVATPISDHALRLTSIGRSLPRSTAGTQEPQYHIQRTLSVVLMRKGKPMFQRAGLPGVLELEASHFDQDGIPDFLEFSGTLDASQTLSGLGGILSAGGPDAESTGYHLLASFTDVDGDGDLDLVLSDLPSRGDQPPGTFIPSLALSQEHGSFRVASPIVADVFHAGTPISVVASRWLLLPEDSLSGMEPDTDVFINQDTYDGTQIISWTEGQLPLRQATH